MLVEKPFGHDVASSKALDDLLPSLFREEQIYRIDHYLAKEMLQGILAFRFHNDLLESDWNRETIERIDISLLETLGVEERGAFYDGVGALRDVGQNHLLQMLALVTTEQPAGLDTDSIRTARHASRQPAAAQVRRGGAPDLSGSVRRLPAGHRGRVGALREDGPQRHRVGMMQAIAEGFAVMFDSPRDLEPVSGSPGHTGESAWTIETAREAGIPVPGIEAALQFRIDAGESPSYTGRVVQALRNEFGGHGLQSR